MSDEEEEWVSEDESQDFSASEDEWKPTKQDKESSDSDFQIDKHSDEDVSKTRKHKLTTKGRSSSSSSSTRARGTSSGSGSIKKRFTQSLRNRLYNKYRPPPKTVSPVKVNSSLSNILNSSKYIKNLSAASSRQEDIDSDSSGDDNLVDPNKIDLSSSFFQKVQKPDGAKSVDAPEFDCNVGCLTDSGSDDDGDPEDQTQTTENFAKLHNFNSTLERAREALKKYQANNIDRANEESKADDIGALLAAGERVENDASKTKSNPVSKRKAVAMRHLSDSEWEDVNELEVKPKTEPSRGDGSVQITVQLPGGHESKRNKKLELELCLKRKLNRIKKENQLDLHKANILCWVAHMNHVNQILNSPLLMAEALKMIPSSQCYPKEKTDIDYFEQLSRFYKTMIVIKNNTTYPPFKQRPKLELSLGLQIKNKSAICKRDYVFIFVILARAIGLQCRIVYNFVVASIRPALADLVPINRTAELKKSNKKIKKEDVKNEGSIPAGSHSIKNEPHEIKKEAVKVESKIKPDLTKMAKITPKVTVPDDKTNEKQIISKTIAKSAQPQKVADSPNHFKKSVNLSKLKLPKGSGGPPPIVNSPIKTRSRAAKINLQIDQLDGANDYSVEPKRRQPANRKKVEAKLIAPTKSKKNIAKPNLAQDVSELPVETVERSNTLNLSTTQGQKVKPGTSKAAGTSLDKPANLAKLKPTVEKVVQKRSSAAKNDSSDEDFRPTRAKKAAKDQEKKELSLELPCIAQDHNVKPGTSRAAVKLVVPKAAEQLVEPMKEKTANQEKLKVVSQKIIKKQKSTPKKESDCDGNLKLSSTKKETNGQEKKNPTSTSLGQMGTPAPSKARPANTKLKTVDKKVVIKRSAADDDSDDVFRPTSTKKTANVKKETNRPVSIAHRTKTGKPIDRRCLSSDDEVPKKKMDGSDYWVELYSEKSKRWYCVDLFKGKVDCPEDLYRQATHPVAYVIAWQNDNTLKDVSSRYCMQWNTTTRTLRVPQYWLDEAFKSFIGKKTDRDKREDLELNKLHMDQPLPKVIGEFKNHPLYALRRHLLKFEEIYPPDALTLGFIRNEPIYSRDCVHTLHSREIWLKQARVVKLGETPYKIVTARPKWDRLTQTVIKGVPLEIFGIWQTKDYEPPTAENGVVPRNAYGNVELFKECMLPKKTLHLKLNGLNRICKKLGIDCAPAVIGFDFHSGSCHPVFDGFVICEEFGDKVVEAWFDDQAEQEKREREKYEKRVYGNWKRLIRGLLIREKIKIKYNLEPLTAND